MPGSLLGMLSRTPNVGFRLPQLVRNPETPWAIVRKARKKSTGQTQGILPHGAGFSSPISSHPLGKAVEKGDRMAQNRADSMPIGLRRRRAKAISDSHQVRIPSALARRASNVELPFAALPAIQELRRLLDDLEDVAVHYARDRGASWEELAEAVGTSRQALQHRIKVRQNNGSRSRDGRGEGSEHSAR